MRKIAKLTPINLPTIFFDYEKFKNCPVFLMIFTIFIKVVFLLLIYCLKIWIY